MCENKKYIVRIGGQLVFVKKEIFTAYYAISRHKTNLHELYECRVCRMLRHISEAQCPQCRARSPPNPIRFLSFFTKNA